MRLYRYFRSFSLIQHFVAGLVLLFAAASAQELQRETKLDLESQSRILTPSLPTMPQPILDAPVDPNEYYVGPSDILAVNIWTSPPISLLLTVTPEGTLIIPTVGEVKVADLPLAEAKRRAIAEIKKKYLIGNPSVTLINPRPVVIQVLGTVRTPGRYVLAASDRADRAIFEANKKLQTGTKEVNEKLEFELEKASKRNLALRRRNGSVVHVDLLKYAATKKDRWNPYLREGDEIVVPTVDQTKNTIGVYGAVHQPGRFEFVEGDSLLDAINLAYGFTRMAIIDSVVLTRFNDPPNVTKDVVLDLRSKEKNPVVNFPLQPGDRIVVKERIELREDFRVTIEGEVQYPGTYPITKNHTRLSQILERAGGLTPFASLSSAQVIRTTVTPEAISLERLMKFRGVSSVDDSAYVTLEQELRIRGGWVKVDFKKLLLEKDSSEDILLQPDDRIIIPNQQKTVYVFGQVVTPSYIPFVPGEDLSYYVAQTGGYTDNARTGDVVVIKKATGQWLAPGETEIEEGDFIWVPKVHYRDFSYYMTIAGQVASVISVAVSIILLTNQFWK